jgi:phospholipid/cholesterol/gamma-HCH transport system substrate-binding protein
MSRQAQVGALAMIALLLLFGVFYIITDFGTRHTGYRIGVHFQSAAGLTSGALVTFSGVTAGSVDSITLLPDNTVDVILAINREIDIPATSRFLIQAPLTGSPTMVIVPPRVARGTVPTLARTVLPVDQQPQGESGATIADLLDQGQGEVKRLDSMLADLEKREPKLLDTLQSSLDNANQLTISANQSISTLSRQLLALTTTLQGSLTTASSNIDELTGTLNGAATTDSKKIGLLLDQFSDTSTALNKSMNSLEELATNPNLKANVLQTTQSIAETTHNLAAITSDLRTVTGDPQTQAQLRNTIANLDATLQRANSLLGALGGTSDVYGVDPNATPAPLAGGSPYPTVTPMPGFTTTPPGAKQGTVGSTPAHLNFQGAVGKLVNNLVELQVRFSGLSPQHACCENPVLTSDRGPQTDINAVFLPHYSTSVMFGANDIGYKTTWNAVLLQSMGSNVRVGAGVLYSQFGVLGNVGIRQFGIDSLLYDPRYPMLDMYGNVRVFKGTKIYFGQRDIFHAARRNVYGMQYSL